MIGKLKYITSPNTSPVTKFALVILPAFFSRFNLIFQCVVLSIYETAKSAVKLLRWARRKLSNIKIAAKLIISVNTHFTRSGYLMDFYSKNNFHPFSQKIEITKIDSKEDEWMRRMNIIATMYQIINVCLCFEIQR